MIYQLWSTAGLERDYQNLMGLSMGRGLTRGSLAWLSLRQQLDEESGCCGACGRLWGSSAELGCSLGSQADRLPVFPQGQCPF